MHIHDFLYIFMTRTCLTNIKTKLSRNDGGTGQRGNSFDCHWKRMESWIGRLEHLIFNSSLFLNLHGFSAHGACHTTTTSFLDSFVFIFVKHVLVMNIYRKSWICMNYLLLNVKQQTFNQSDIIYFVILSYLYIKQHFQKFLVKICISLDG
jgi:hypothetical protein